MTLRLNCPECGERLRLDDDMAGEKTRCPECRTAFRVPDESDEDERDERTVRGEDRPRRSAVDDRPRRRPDEDEEERPRPRRKRQQASGGGTTLILVIGGLVLLFVIGGGAVAGGLAFFLMRKPAVNNNPPMAMAPLPGGAAQPMQPAPDNWQTIEAPGRFRVRFPGPAPQGIEPGIVPVVMYKMAITSDPFCSAGYSQQPLPPERLQQVPVNQILDDACNGGSLSARAKGGVEVSRRPVMLGNYPGRELVVNVPAARGKLVSRFYLVKGTLYVVMIGGTGIEPESEATRKMFESFQILE